MNKIWEFVALWGYFVTATLGQVYISTLQAISNLKIVGILSLAFSEVLLSAGYYQNLRHEKKFLVMLPLIAMLAVLGLMITAILSVGG
jgi:hypothetical protein